MAGGGCTLPGKAMVLMPGMGYEGVTKFVLDQMTSYGLNACPRCSSVSAWLPAWKPPRCSPRRR